MSAERLTLKKEILEMRAKSVVASGAFFTRDYIVRMFGDNAAAAWDDMMCAKVSFLMAAQKTITELEGVE